MDIYELFQITMVGMSGLVFARLGLALARRIERPRAREEARPAADDRVRALEDECAVLRRELGELQERQDFTERLLLRDPGHPAPLGRTDDRVVTPH